MVRSIALLLLVMSHLALARDDGRFAQVDPATREWFRSQKVPGGPQRGMSCCDIADGVHAEEQVRNGEYWFRYETREGVKVDWQRAGPDQLITEPNTFGFPVVWYWHKDGKLEVRCAIPGAGI